MAVTAKLTSSAYQTSTSSIFSRTQSPLMKEEVTTDSVFKKVQNLTSCLPSAKTVARSFLYTASVSCIIMNTLVLAGAFEINIETKKCIENCVSEMSETINTNQLALNTIFGPLENLLVDSEPFIEEMTRCISKCYSIYGQQ